MGKGPKFRSSKNGALKRHFPQAYRPPRTRWKPRRRWGPQQSAIAAIGLSLGALAGIYLITDGEALAGITIAAAEPEFACASVRIIDGDTFDCGSTRVRLHGIDSPEMPGHCRPGRECTPGDPYASTASLQALAGRGSVSCRKVDIDAYGRTVARCSAAGEDLSCAQIEGGFAVRRYGWIIC